MTTHPHVPASPLIGPRPLVRHDRRRSLRLRTRVSVEVAVRRLEARP